MKTPKQIAKSWKDAFEVRDGDVQETSWSYIKGVIADAIAEDRKERPYPTLPALHMHPRFGIITMPQHFAIRDLCLDETKPTFARDTSGEVKLTLLVDGEHTEFCVYTSGEVTKSVFDALSFGWTEYKYDSITETWSEE